MLTGYAHIGFALGKHDMQLLPLLEAVGIADDLATAVFHHAEAARKNMLRRHGFEQRSLFFQALAAQIE